MKLEDIEDWDNLRTYLNENFNNPKKKYKETTDYFQGRASEYLEAGKTPLPSAKLAFQDTIKYLKKLE